MKALIRAVFVAAMAAAVLAPLAGPSFADTRDAGHAAGDKGAQDSGGGKSGRGG